MGKKVLKLFVMGCVAGSMLVAAGCGGGGGGGSSVTGSSVSGVVADGYLVGAEVFLDLNDNKVWDEGEPKATTGEHGLYTLEGVTGADVAAHPVVVRVPANAVDEDTNTQVGSEYLMSAPPGLPEFVSPLTTLVHNQLEENPALGVSAAEDAVKSQMGMTGTTIDLFKDYVAEKEASGNSAEDQANYAKAHEIAKVVAAVVRENLAVVGNSADTNIALKVALAQVTDNLPLIVGQVSEAIEIGVNPVTGGVNIENIMMSLSSQVVIDQSAIAEVIAEQEQKAPAVSSSFKDALSGDGFYWFDEMDDMYGLTYEYGVVKLGAASGSGFPLSEQFFRLNGGVWGPGDSTDSEFVLISGAWVEESDSVTAGTVSFAADGSAVWTRTQSQLKERIVVSSMNMAGKPIMLPSGDGVSNSGAVYPAGSIFYKMTFTPLQDVYSFMDDSSRFPSFANLNDFMAAHTAGGNFSVVVGEDFGFRFGAQTAQDAGVVEFYTAPFSYTPVLLPLKGVWKLSLVHGQPILTVTVPAGYKREFMDIDMNEELIFFVMNGGIQQGHVEYANVPQIEEGMNFNKTAFDAFMAAWNNQ